MRMSWRVFLGGMAALLGVSATATELVTASADPVTTDNGAGLQSQSAYVPGTYTSCTAKFGLMKTNSDLATFDVVDGSPAVTPSPVVGSNLIPLITVSDGTITETCEAQLAWTDSATFDSAFLSYNSFAAGTSMQYPGTNDFWIMPAVGVPLTMDGTTAITVSTRTLSFGDTLPVGTTVTLSAQPLSIQAPYAPYGGQLSSSAALATPFFERVSDAVRTNGDAGQETFLNTFLTSYYNSIDPSQMCTDDPTTANALFITMDGLMTGWGYSSMLPTGCSNLVNSDLAVAQILQYDTQVSSETTLTVTVAGPPLPTTTTVPTTSTTATTDPVVPQFTG
jgi:hypothetical protein